VASARPALQPLDFLLGFVALRDARAASARRARRSFFFCWPLRRVIFSELRLSNRPIVSSVSFCLRARGLRALLSNCPRAKRGAPHTVLFPLGKVFRLRARGLGSRSLLSESLLDGYGELNVNGARRRREEEQLRRVSETSARGGVFEGALAIANFQAVTAVDRLDVENVFCG
jgi:hypothetical protein